MNKSTSGTVEDPELAKIYGKHLILKVNGLLERCKNRKIKIATAESLTAGGICTLLTTLNGSSDVIDCGFIVYNNPSKERLLGVSPDSLENYSEVSAEVAEEMALGALEKSEANITVAVTGFAGSNGSENFKIPGGTVFISTAIKCGESSDKNITNVNKFCFTGGRTGNRKETIEKAIDALEEGVELILAKK